MVSLVHRLTAALLLAASTLAGAQAPAANTSLSPYFAVGMVSLERTFLSNRASTRCRSSRRASMSPSPA